MADDAKFPVPPKPQLDLVVIDCPDALALAQFYADVLGWAVEDGSDRNWATLVPPGGGLSPDNPAGRTSLAFQRIDDFVTPTWPGGEHPQQFHLDLWAGDIDTHEEAVLAAGATRHDHQPSDTGSFRVYTDPVGHPFCLIGRPTA
jgi:predicted enzyme related to lactoylglutathione lyase